MRGRGLRPVWSPGPMLEQRGGEHWASLAQERCPERHCLVCPVLSVWPLRVWPLPVSPALPHRRRAPGASYMHIRPFRACGGCWCMPVQPGERGLLCRSLWCAPRGQALVRSGQVAASVSSARQLTLQADGVPVPGDLCTSPFFSVGLRKAAPRCRARLLSRPRVQARTRPHTCCIAPLSEDRPRMWDRLGLPGTPTLTLHWLLCTLCAVGPSRGAMFT